MTITLPKALKTYQYRRLTVFTLADTDIDRVLPHLFELCVKGGRSSRSRTDSRAFARYREQMLSSGWVVGFDSPDDRVLLDGWLRSSIVDMGAVGRGHTGEQMLSVAPLTLAAYRAGLPKERSRHRGIDEFVYRWLVAEVNNRASGAAKKELHALVARTLGRGLAIGPQPRWEPHLANAAKLDIAALLAFRFLENFEMSDAKEVNDLAPDSPLPGVSAAMGACLLSHLTVYGEELPTQSLTASFAALLSITVFTMSLRIDAAARELLRTGEVPADMLAETSSSPVELYCDFTGDIGSESDRLTRRCVERDLDRVRLAFRDRMAFMIVSNAISRMPEEKARQDASTVAEQLIQLANLREHPRVETYAEGRIDDIVAGAEDDEGATDAEREFLRETQGRPDRELDKLLDILEFVNRRKATANSVGWFWSVGGLQKPYGILDGSLRNRRSWRYAPSDELLVALLLAVFVRPGGRDRRSLMPLQDVLTALRDRFGVFVDRPPAFLDGAEARAAAAGNLEAFKRRIQLLGCFDSLSDDFSVQHVRHPLGEF